MTRPFELGILLNRVPGTLARFFSEMLPSWRRFAAAATAFSLIVGLQLSSAEAASDACATQADVTVLPSPISPWTGAPLRVMVITERPVAGTLSLVAPDGSVAVKSSDRHEGPPFSWFAEVATPAAGTWRAVLEGRSAEC